MPSPSPAPSVELTFRAQLPSQTPEGSGVTLVLLDEVTGFAFNRRTLPMRRVEAGAVEVQVELAYGSLQYYRYELLDPSVPERASDGSPVSARVVWVQSSLRVEDAIASWTDEPAQAATGRVAGRLRQAGDAPLPEQIVVLNGQWRFTDGEGGFSFQAVPPGLHRLTAFSPDGAYRSLQQGVVVAEGKLTPVQLDLERAPTVRVSFEVTVPDDTTPGGLPRVGGNLRQLGQRFAEMPGGVRLASQTMPPMTRVDDTHYLWIAELPAGFHLHYKYSLGDGLWNAERTPEGFFHVREVAIPETELQLQDTVSSWRGQHGVVLFQVTAPENTPPGDRLSIQLNPAAGFAPLPMQPLSERDWFFVLHGPLDLDAPLSYRYCRNLRCGSADDAATAGPASAGRQLSLNPRGTSVQEAIAEWAWWDGPPTGEGIVSPDLQPTGDLELGVEPAPEIRPDWLSGIRQAIAEIRSRGSNAIVLSPAWSVAQDGGLPTIGLDPSRAPFAAELLDLIVTARGVGLVVTLKPSLVYPMYDPEAWWSAVPRGPAWWTAWFDAYRTFALRHASLAEQGGARRLVLGGAESAPFLPGGRVADGEAEGRWRGLIAEIRSSFSGRLAFELDLGRELQAAPVFLGQFDEVVLHWHAPLGERPDLSLGDMRDQAAQLLDTTLSAPELSGLPVILSMSYPSLDGGAGPCAAPEAGRCLGLSSALAGEGSGIVLPVDLQEQAWAVNAILLEAYDRPGVRGIFSRGYDPLAALQDDGISVHGKPAAEVLWYWFARLTGSVSG